MVPYTVTIVGLEDFQDYYNSTFFFNTEHNREMRYSLLEKELGYDWIITNAINNLAMEKGAKVIGHYRHDIYICLYDHYKYYIESQIRDVFINNRIDIQAGDIVKVLISDRVLFISRGVLRV